MVVVVLVEVVEVEKNGIHLIVQVEIDSSCVKSLLEGSALGGRRWETTNDAPSFTLRP